MKKLLAYLVPIVIFLIAWEAASRSMKVNAALLPPPSTCFRALIEWTRHDDMKADLIASGKRVAAGLLGGSVLGIVAGLLTGRLSFAEMALVPLIRTFRVLPPVALIPLFIVWWGIDEPAKIFSIAFATFFPVWLNTFTAARQIPQRLLWSASTLTRSPVRMFFRIILPACVPGIITGIRLGIATAFVMVFVSELMGADAGIGYKISIWQLAYRMDSMIAGLFVLGAVGGLFDWLFVRVMFWKFRWLRFTEVNLEVKTAKSISWLPSRIQTQRPPMAP